MQASAISDGTDTAHTGTCTFHIMDTRSLEAGDGKGRTTQRLNHAIPVNCTALHQLRECSETLTFKRSSLSCLSSFLNAFLYFAITREYYRTLQVWRFFIRLLNQTSQRRGTVALSPHRDIRGIPRFMFSPSCSGRDTVPETLPSVYSTSSSCAFEVPRLTDSLPPSD